MIQFLNTEDDIDKTHCAKSLIFFLALVVLSTKERQVNF